jgi:myo-inositol-1-phosphate synthase
MHNDIGGYFIKDINVVVGIDVNIEKIGVAISESIFKTPNCTKIFCKKTLFKNKVIA